MLRPFSVVIPCFNEAGRIGETVRLALEYLTANAAETPTHFGESSAGTGGAKEARQ